jgi:hypothetical protein
MFNLEKLETLASNFMKTDGFSIRVAVHGEEEDGNHKMIRRCSQSMIERQSMVYATDRKLV